MQVKKGTLSIGALFAITLYVSKFWSPMEFLIRFYKEYARDCKIIDSFDAFLNVEPITYETSCIKKLELVDVVMLDHERKYLNKPLNHVFEQGKLYVIKGNNGCGKTTLLLSILGLCDRYEGSIDVSSFGKNDMFMYSNAEPLKSEFSVSKKESKEMSMGQYKIAQLKQDFNEDKDVYVFDEPTNYLDHTKKDFVVEKLMELRNKGKIVLVVSHDDALLDACDEVLNIESL